MENRSQLPPGLPENGFPSALRTTHIMHTFLRQPPFTIGGILFLECLSVLLGG